MSTLEFNLRAKRTIPVEEKEAPPQPQTTLLPLQPGKKYVTKSGIVVHTGVPNKLQPNTYIAVSGLGLDLIKAHPEYVPATFAWYYRETGKIYAVGKAMEWKDSYRIVGMQPEGNPSLLEMEQAWMAGKKIQCRNEGEELWKPATSYTYLFLEKTFQNHADKVHLTWFKNNIAVFLAEWTYWRIVE